MSHGSIVAIFEVNKFKQHLGACSSCIGSRTIAEHYVNMKELIEEVKHIACNVDCLYYVTMRTSAIPIVLCQRLHAQC